MSLIFLLFNGFYNYCISTFFLCVLAKQLSTHRLIVPPYKLSTVGSRVFPVAAS